MGARYFSEELIFSPHIGKKSRAGSRQLKILIGQSYTLKSLIRKQNDLRQNYPKIMGKNRAVTECELFLHHRFAS